MPASRSTAALVASALLGVISAAAVITGAFMLFGAWTTSVALDGPTRDLGIGAAVFIGVVAIAFGGLAGFAAHDEWLGRTRGLVLGLTAAFVSTLAAAATLLVGRTSGGVDALLGVAIAIGVAAAVAVLVDARREAGRTPAPAR